MSDAGLWGGCFIGCPSAHAALHEECAGNGGEDGDDGVDNAFGFCLVHDDD